MTQFRYAIVLYAYNQEDCVRAGVQSVLAQDCAPIDIVLSDDCSQDGTFKVFQEEAAAYSGPHRIILNRNPQNLGVIAHINRVFTLTDADVLINLAGDDLCLPDRARKTIEVFERDRPLLVCSRARAVYEDGSPAPHNYAKADFYHKVDALTASTSMQSHLGATACWHRDLFTKYGPIRFKECFEDLVFGFRAALEDRVAVIDDELIIYQMGRGITNSARGPETPSEVRKRRDKELRYEISSLEQRQLDAGTFGLGQGHAISRRISKALKARKLRRLYVTEGLMPVLKAGLLTPLLTLGAILSENRRWRKALRNS